MFRHVLRYPSKEFDHIVSKRGFFLSDVKEKVSHIIEDVKLRGDEAIRESLSKYHRMPKNANFVIKKDELQEYVKKAPHEYVDIIRSISNNLEALMKKLVPDDVEIDFGTHKTGVSWRPLRSVGIYVPGGRASYPSTAVMTVVPAKVAGVEEIYVATPPKEGGLPDKYTLATLGALGVKEVFLVGGAEAVAAFAYGTQSIPRVDKIVGPGGVWFTTAKALVAPHVGIDILAGPTELVVVADETADPYFIAWDLAAQSEHSPDTFPVLVSTDESLVGKTVEELINITKRTPRGDIIREAISNNGIAVITEDLSLAVDAVNKLAPEHVHVSTKEPRRVFDKIANAGAVTLGELTPSSFPDYFAGVNHVLPTGSWARFRGGLSVLDFLKPVYFTEITCEGLKAYYNRTRLIAGVEGLWAHFGALESRLEKGMCSNGEEKD